MPDDESDILSKACKFCNKPIYGRSDKIFCSTPCRNAWHNEDRREREHIIRETNKILKRNWIILRALNKKGKTRVTKMQLLSKDFDFVCITGILVTRANKHYRYCYDQGYLDLGDDNYLLVASMK